MKVVTVWNMKGGVGKTTISFNLAANLARKGHQVLCLDFDPQANLTSFFEAGRNRKHCKADIAELAKLNFSCMHLGIYRSKYKNLDFIRGSNREARPSSISGLWEGIHNGGLWESLYDYCVIDCHPDYSKITQAALYAADMVLVPISLDAFSRDNLNLVRSNLNQIEELREVYGWGADLPYRVVANRVANRKCQKEVYQDLVMRHDYPFLDVFVNECAAVSSANAMHKPLYMHRSNAQPTKNMAELTDILIGLLADCALPERKGEQ